MECLSDFVAEENAMKNIIICDLDGTIPKDRVVQMWRRHGLTCYQVADGDF